MSQINKLTLSEFETYLEIALRTQAEERLYDMNINDYSNCMNKEGRKKLFTILQKRAYPDRMKQGIKFSEFARKQDGERKD